MKMTKEILSRFTKEELIEMYLSKDSEDELINKVNAFKDQRVHIKQKFRSLYESEKQLTQYMYTFNVVNNILYGIFKKYVPSGYQDGNPGSTGSKSFILSEEDMNLISKYGLTKQTIYSLPYVKAFMKRVSGDYDLSTVEEITELKIPKNKPLKKHINKDELDIDDSLSNETKQIVESKNKKDSKPSKKQSLNTDNGLGY